MNIFLKIIGKIAYLYWAVIFDGRKIDSYVSENRDKNAFKKFL